VVAQKILVPKSDPNYPGKDVNAWVEFTNDTANACSFVFCFMLDLKLDDVAMDSYTAAKDANQKWACTKKAAQTMAKPNFHYGCTEVTVPAFAGRGKAGDPAAVTAFKDPANAAKLKTPVQMDKPFTADKLGVVYMDMLKDCPVAPSCALCKANQFLVPEAPTNHGDWVNTWVGGQYFTLTDKLLASADFPKGNWVTMALADSTFPGTLTGALTGAPPGTTFALAMPGSDILTLTVAGNPQTCTGTDLAVTSPYNIANGGNDRVTITVTAPSGPCGALAEGQVIRFNGQVLASATGSIYQAGDYMLGIDLLYIRDTQPPVITGQSILTDPAGDVSVFVRATDATSYPSGANITYSVNGGPPSDISMSVLAASRTAVNNDVGFVADLGVLPNGARLSLQTTVSDEAGLTVTAPATNAVANRPAGMLALVNSASFARNSIAPESLATVFGQSLGTGQASAMLPLPTVLANTTVWVIDAAGKELAAPLYFVSPAQINFLVPPGTAAGPAAVRISSGDGTVSVASVPVGATAPGLYSANASGTGVAAALAVHVLPDGSQQVSLVYQCDLTGRCTPSPIDLGGPNDQVVLVLFGTGLRFVSSPDVAAATVGGQNSTLLYLGPQSQYPGLDQANVLLPRTLAGSGTVPVVISVDGTATNAVTVGIR
jgi:uncharacterized protein (TIGR03437 family)